MAGCWAGGGDRICSAYKAPPINPKLQGRLIEDKFTNKLSTSKGGGRVSRLVNSAYNVSQKSDLPGYPVNLQILKTNSNLREVVGRLGGARFVVRIRYP